jgi:glycosyltransferase involved in cell wall biosynthesis
MGTSPGVTVVITTKDRRTLLRRAVASALGQRREVDTEIIVVDDGSVEPVSSLGDGIQIIRNQTSRGLCGARNVGLQAARKEWITWLDDDDELLPGALGRALAAASRRSSDPSTPVSVLSAMEVVDDDGAHLETMLPASLPQGSVWLFAPLDGRSRVENTLVTPTQVAHRIGGWDETIRAFEMDDFFMRLAAASAILGVDVAGYRMYVDPRRATLSRNWPLVAEGMWRTARKHHAVFRQYRRQAASYYAAVGWYFLKAGRWARAIDCEARAVLWNPARQLHWVRLAAALAGPQALHVALLLRRA